MMHRLCRCVGAIWFKWCIGWIGLAHFLFQLLRGILVLLFFEREKIIKVVMAVVVVVDANASVLVVVMVVVAAAVSTAGIFLLVLVVEKSCCWRWWRWWRHYLLLHCILPPPLASGLKQASVAATVIATADGLFPVYCSCEAAIARWRWRRLCFAAVSYPSSSFRVGFKLSHYPSPRVSRAHTPGNTL